jgi:hypothetical protein
MSGGISAIKGFDYQKEELAVRRPAGHSARFRETVGH